MVTNRYMWRTGSLTGNYVDCRALWEQKNSKDGTPRHNKNEHTFPEPLIRGAQYVINLMVFIVTTWCAIERQGFLDVLRYLSYGMRAQFVWRIEKRGISLRFIHCVVSTVLLHRKHSNRVRILSACNPIVWFILKK